MKLSAGCLVHGEPRGLLPLGLWWPWGPTVSPWQLWVGDSSPQAPRCQERRHRRPSRAELRDQPGGGPQRPSSVSSARLLLL